MKIFKKILIANRGEIAVRIMKTAKKLNIGTVAIYSEVDKDSLHVSFADEAYCIGKVELSETYLNIEKILAVAKKTNCDAVHPGYGFMSENSQFVKACDEAGIVFIGPNTNAMHVMGNKILAREFVKKINIPMTEGVTGNPAALIKASKNIQFPLLIKAAAGGGGKGMRIVHNENELADAVESTSREAKAYFGDETVYIEKFIENPRHIEIQILGDNHGNVIHLFERECTIQRRYQKIIEESPSVTLTPEVRKKMGEAAVKIGKEIKYNNAGTIEFLVDKDLNFYFLEMNTRVQVEHPVTEMVTGVDIVEEQINIAEGHPLRFKQEDIKQNGHALECRIYAEDPSNNFLPSPGTMTFYKESTLGGIRIDTGIAKATEVKSFFDPMICKLIVWAKDREGAIDKMQLALNDYIIHGIQTNIDYLSALLKNKDYVKNNISTKFCDSYTLELISAIKKEEENIPHFIPLIAFAIYSMTDNSNQVSKNNQNEFNLWNTIGFWRDVMNLKIVLSENEYYLHLTSRKKNVFEFVLNEEKYTVSLDSSKDGKLDFTINNNSYAAFLSKDKKGNAFVSYNGHIFKMNRKDILSQDSTTFSIEDFLQDTDSVTSPMPGKVIKIKTKQGLAVKKGEVVIIIEAMKMENHIVVSKDCKIETIHVKEGDMVESSTTLISLEKN